MGGAVELVRGRTWSAWLRTDCGPGNRRAAIIRIVYGREDIIVIDSLL